MNRLLIGLCWLASLSACAKNDRADTKNSDGPAAKVEEESAAKTTAQAAPRAPVVPEIRGDVSEEEGLAAAHDGARALGGLLKKKLMTAMQMSGPEDALSACAIAAQDLTHSVGNSRLRVGRSTLRLRNPKNAEAPEWVRSWLQETGERKAQGLEGVNEVVDGTARVLAPLEVGNLCLACHGDPAAHSEGMKNILASQYPNDQATGYEAGDLRGVIWAEFDLKDPAQ